MGVEYHSGARQSYGPYAVEEKASAVTRVAGVVKQLIQPLHYDNLPESNEDDEVIAVVPANSFIVSARVYVEDDFDSTSGTTTVHAGLEQADGTAIDVDGFVDAGTALTADGTNAGWTVGDGDLVGASVGANDGQVVAAGSADDLTAGVGYLIVEYIEAPNIS